MNLMWGDRQRPFSGHFRGGIYRPVTAVSPGLEFFLSPLRNACPELGAIGPCLPISLTASRSA